MLDSETQKSPKNETSRPIKNAKKFLKNFPRPMFIEVPFYTSLTLHVLQAYVAMGKTHVLRILSWVSIQTNNCQWLLVVSWDSQTVNVSDVDIL